MHPITRHDRLIVTTLNDELLIYDLDRDRAHCLNRAAALIWKHCDGETGIDALSDLLDREFGAELGDDYVWYGLRRLNASRLLVRPLEGAPANARCSRRELLRRLAAAGVASVALPTVLSLIAPTTLHAQASCLPIGSGCNPPNIPCCPGLRCRGLPPGSPGTCRP